MDNYSTQRRLEVSDAMRAYLKKTAKYAKVITILGYISCGLYVITGIFMMILQAENNLAAAIGVGFVYIIVSFIVFYPATYCHGFAEKTKVALSSDNQMIFEDGLKNLKSLFAFYFYMLIIVMGLVGLALFSFIVGDLLNYSAGIIGN
jgi:hypothetical protein